MADFIAWHGRDLADHVLLTAQWYGNGYRFQSLSIYGLGNGAGVRRSYGEDAEPGDSNLLSELDRCAMAADF